MTVVVGTTFIASTVWDREAANFWKRVANNQSCTYTVPSGKTFLLYGIWATDPFRLNINGERLFSLGSPIVHNFDPPIEFSEGTEIELDAPEVTSSITIWGYEGLQGR